MLPSPEISFGISLKQAVHLCSERFSGKAKNASFVISYSYYNHRSFTDGEVILFINERAHMKA